MASSSSGNWGLILSLLLLLLNSLFVSSATSPSCAARKFSGDALFSRCADLPSLSASLHWSYDSSNSSLSVAFYASPAKPGGWIAWAVNPTADGMVGSQALVAFVSDGVPTVKTYNVASYGSVLESKLSFEVWDTSAEFSGGVLTIFAKLKVPAGAATVNHVWQVGPAVEAAGRLAAHDFAAANLKAKGALDLSGGGGGGGVGGVTPAAGGGGGVDARTRRKNIHGVLNAVSWGFLFPIGVVIARYLRVFPEADPAWFYLHISCQISAYAIGVAGWATGMKLGSESVGYQVSDHRNIGIALFAMATVQMFALFLRPKKDHKYRVFWNVYHHSVGYSIVILSIINVFKGFHILSPDRKWKSTYIVVIIAIAVIAVLLESFTWVVVLKRKGNTKSTKPYDPETRP